MRGGAQEEIRRGSLYFLDQGAIRREKDRESMSVAEREREKESHHVPSLLPARRLLHRGRDRRGERTGGWGGEGGRERSL